MKKILVTGCNGFIGKHVCSRFAEKGYAVSGIDIAGAPDPRLCRYVQGQMTKESLAELGEPFDVIIHLAGPGTVSAAEQNAEALSRRILNNVRIVLESARMHPETLLLFPSSAAVYGDQKTTPTTEECPRMPLSQYGRNKVAEEMLCEEYHRLYGCRVCMIRFFSIYGPGLRKQLLWDFSKRLADAQNAGKDSVPCFGTGEETRDFLYIDDVVRIFELFCRANPDWQVVNAGTGIAHSVRQVLTGLASAYDCSLKLDFDGIIRPGNPMHLLADIEKLKAMGFAPSVSFEEGIQRYARWAEQELHIGKI